MKIMDKLSLNNNSLETDKISKLIVYNSTFLNYVCSDFIDHTIEIPELLVDTYKMDNWKKLLLKRIRNCGYVLLLSGLIFKTWNYKITKYLIGLVIGFGVTIPIDKYLKGDVIYGKYHVDYVESIYKESINNYFRKNGKIYESKLYGINNTANVGKLYKIYLYVKHDILGFDIITDMKPYVKYDGLFKGLQYHGYGKLYYPSGKLFIYGEFYHGLPVWSNKIYLENGKQVQSNKKMNSKYLRHLHSKIIER